MIEILALPGWETPETPLSAWVEFFASQGHRAVVSRESTGVSWIEVNSLRLRGYAVMEGSHVEAINFELTDPDPGPALLALEQAAAALAWDLDDEQDQDVEDDG
jgi:hypothetical protein